MSDLRKHHIDYAEFGGRIFIGMKGNLDTSHDGQIMVFPFSQVARDDIEVAEHICRLWNAHVDTVRRSEVVSDAIEKINAGDYEEVDPREQD